MVVKKIKVESYNQVLWITESFAQSDVDSFPYLSMNIILLTIAFENEKAIRNSPIYIV